MVIESKPIRATSYFTQNDIFNIYHDDYINHALLPLIKSGIVEARFISVKDLYPIFNKANNIWNENINNPYVNHYYNAKESLGLSVLSDGMYFPFYVSQISGTDKYFVFEGRHRIDSLRMLMKKGVLDPNTKFLCMVSPTIFYHNYDIYKTMELKYPVEYRSFSKVFSGESRFLTSNNPTSEINKYTNLYFATTVFDLINAVERYQYDLSCWFYYYDIPKSKIINDEQEFNQWIKGFE